jgi:hypothetical protein
MTDRTTPQDLEPMKRLTILALALGLFAPIGLLGCSDETEKTKIETSGPGGSSTTEIKKTTDGDGGPAAGGSTATPGSTPTTTP